VLLRVVVCAVKFHAWAGQGLSGEEVSQPWGCGAWSA